MTLEQLATQGKRTETLTMAATISESIIKARRNSLKECFVDCEHLKHRNELVGTKNGVNYIDDSGANCVSATYFTLNNTTTPTIWVTVSGNEDYEELISVVRQSVVSIICIGACSEKINNTLGSVVRGGVKTVNNMAEALTLAYSMATSGQNVLFSPAAKVSDVDNAAFAKDFVGFKADC